MPTKSKVSQALENMEEGAEAQPVTKTRGFDYNNYKVDNSPVVHILEIDDEEFEVTVKPLTWSKKNQFMSKCLKWDNDGNTIFDGDLYVREVLREIIVQAPWGKTTELFLISIDERLGSVLETLVQAPYGGAIGDVDNLKEG